MQSIMNENKEYIRIEFPDGKRVEIGSNFVASVSDGHSEAREDFPQLFLNKEKGRKLDLIRIINVIWELGFIVDEHGRKALKKEVFQAFGILLHTDFSNFSSDLSGSLADGSSMNKHTKVFEEMLEKMKSIFNLA